MVFKSRQCGTHGICIFDAMPGDEIGKMVKHNFLGSSKFDKLRRISVIKPVADRLGLKEGDKVDFFDVYGHVTIMKRQEFGIRFL